jgi:hypothetical protein
MDLLITNLHWVVISLVVIVLLLLISILRLQRRINTFLIGTGSKNIDDTFKHLDKELKDLATFRKELESYLLQVEQRLRRSAQSVQTVRFNPFKGTGGGGNQSFATTIINEDGDGVIISSLYSREHVSIFGKPLKKFASEFELSEEEKESVEKAKTNLETGKKK